MSASRLGSLSSSSSDSDAGHDAVGRQRAPSKVTKAVTAPDQNSPPVKKRKRDSSLTTGGAKPNVAANKNKRKRKRDINGDGEDTTLRRGPTNTAARSALVGQQPILPRGMYIADAEEKDSSNPVLQQLLRSVHGSRGSRYFNEARGHKCFNCGLEGHNERDCTVTGLHPCNLCAQFDHESRSCPQMICFECGGKGHLAAGCRAPRLPRPCMRCGKTECAAAGKGDYFRYEVGCDTDYGRSDMKSVRCLVCNQLGHLCCAKAPQVPARLSCYVCGEEGHLGEACKAAVNQAVARERVFETRRELAAQVVYGLQGRAPYAQYPGQQYPGQRLSLDGMNGLPTGTAGAPPDRFPRSSSAPRPGRWRDDPKPGAYTPWR